MWNFQDLNKSIAPAGFQFKELDNCVLYFHLVFDDDTNFAKTLESIKVDDDLHVQLQYNGMSLPLPQWFFQGHNAGNTEKSKLITPPTTSTNTWMNLIKETFISHNIQHQQFCMSYIYVIYHSKRTGYYLKNFQCSLCHC